MIASYWLRAGGMDGILGWNRATREAESAEATYRLLLGQNSSSLPSREREARDHAPGPSQFLELGWGSVQPT